MKYTKEIHNHIINELLYQTPCFAVLLNDESYKEFKGKVECKCTIELEKKHSSMKGLYDMVQQKLNHNSYIDVLKKCKSYVDMSEREQAKQKLIKQIREIEDKHKQLLKSLRKFNDGGDNDIIIDDDNNDDEDNEDDEEDEDEDDDDDGVIVDDEDDDDDDENDDDDEEKKDDENNVDVEKKKTKDNEK